MGRLYGVERDPDDKYPEYPKRITFLIDPSGLVAKVYEVIDAGTHPDEVLADLRALAAG